MADPLQQEADAFFGVTQSTNTQLSVNDPSATPALAPVFDSSVTNASKLTPLTNQAYNSTVNAIPKSVVGTPDLGGMRRDDTGGLIPIDTREGIPLDAYARIAEQRLPEDKVSVLRKIYPDKPIRVFPNGDISIEINDGKTGKPKDVMLNPTGMDAHDLTDLAVQTPEIAAGIAAAIATEGKGAMKTLGQILASSFYSGVAGGVRDVTQRTVEGLPIRPDEIVRARTEEGLFNTAGSIALGVGAKALGVLSPFSRTIDPKTLAFDFNKGAANLEKDFGESLKRLPSEITGSPILGKIEAVEAPQPGSSSVLGTLKEERGRVLQRIQARALGKITPEEEIGQQAIDILQRKTVQPVEDAVIAARQSLEAKGQSELLQQFDEITGMVPGSRVTPFAAGGATREAFESELASAHALKDAAYAKVREIPGGTEKIIPGNPLVKAAKEIEDELAKVEETTMVKGYSRDGNPIEVPVTKTKILPSGVPDSLQKFLSDMKAMGGQKMTLQELTNLKNAARDEIAKTEAVPGVKDRWFKMVSKAYSDAMEEGVSGIKDPALKEALATAKKTYIEKVLPFDENGISDIARTSFEAGFKSNEGIINRLFTGDNAIENYRALKARIGPAHMKAINRSFLDTQMEAAKDEVTGLVNPNTLYQSLKNLAAYKPEIAEEVFGKRFREVALNLKKMAVTGMEDIPPDEVRRLLSSPGPIDSMVKTFMAASQARKTLYQNELLRDIADGLPIASNANPTKIVSTLLDPTFPTSKTKQILDVIAKESPELRDAISTAQLSRLFDEASVPGANAANQSFRGEQVNLSASKLSEAVGAMGSSLRKRVELLLGDQALPIIPGEVGPTRIKTIENLIGVLAPAEERQRAMATAGSMSSGGIINRLFDKPFQYATTWAKKKMLAILYTSPRSVKLISNSVFDDATTASIANFLIASEPVIYRAVEVFGPEQAKRMISELKSSIDKHMGEITKNQSEANRLNSAEIDKQEALRFMRGEPALIKQKAIY